MALRILRQASLEPAHRPVRTGLALAVTFTCSIGLFGLLQDSSGCLVSIVCFLVIVVFAMIADTGTYWRCFWRLFVVVCCIPLFSSIIYSVPNLSPAGWLGIFLAVLGWGSLWICFRPPPVTARATLLVLVQLGGLAMQTRTWPWQQHRCFGLDGSHGCQPSL